MKVEIKNAMMAESINLLFDLSLKGKQSRHRTKFIKLLTERLKEVEEQRKELAEEHSRKDEEGNVLMKNDDTEYDIIDIEAFKNDVADLYNEIMVIEGGDNKTTLKTVKKVLDECDKELKGREAVIYDYLCEQFEKGEDKNDDKN